MGKFVIKTSDAGCRFNLVAGNGQVIGSSQIYSSMDACKNGIESVKTNAPVAEIEDQTKEGFETKTNPKFEVYTDKAGEFRFRLTARNGQNILASEGYAQMAGCQNGIESVKKNAPDAEIEEAE
ncbi:MAG: YegP family protein [Clostridia bacterium]|nr:YegP family protein [Clostridia bacterium]